MTLLAALFLAGPPHSPAESVDLLFVAPGYAVQIAAAEPDVIDPIAIAFDESGRLWVVEMGDYPLGPGPGEKPKGRVRVLEPLAAAGPGGPLHYGRPRIFVDEVLFATGVQPWKGGAFVTSELQVLYLRDTDGDGRADSREVIFEGFAKQNSQLLPNHPTWGLDNRIHVANGLRASDVRRPGAAGEPLSIRGRDFAFDPFTRGAEAETGHGQFGLTFDDAGEAFVCSNRNHVQHAVLAERYTARSPYAPAATVEDVPDHEAAARLFPLSRNWTTSNLHAGTFTAACGVNVYRGDLMPELEGDVFVCDPTANAVHHDRLRPAGGTFVASRVEKDSEFVRSPDEWFRPVNLATGPDGALHVVDMCRAVIEHPEWVPPELKNPPNLMDGNDRGRIYRIVPKPARAAPAPGETLAAGKTSALVAALADENGWRRDVAQRLLVESRDASAAGLLEASFKSSPSPLGRLHALWALEGLGALDARLVERALSDPDARVRRNALRLAEPKLAAGSSLARAAAVLAADEDPAVRFQAALTLGLAGGEEALLPLARIAEADSEDRWTRVAVLLSARRPVELLAKVLGEGSAPPPRDGRVDLVRSLSALAAEEGEDATASVLVLAGHVVGPQAARWVRVVVAGLLDGARRKGRSIPEDATVRSAALDAARAAANPDLAAVERIEAVQVLSGAPSVDGARVLGRLVLGTAEPEVRAAAVRGLGLLDADRAAVFLLDHWSEHTPAVRREAADLLLARPSTAALLVTAVEDGRVKPAELEAPQRARLLQHADAALRGRAEKLFAAAAKDRAAVVEKFRGALALHGELKHGREVFAKACATCHRVGGLGIDVGPDVSDTRDKTPEALLHDILEPNRAIDGKYIAYAVTTQDGRAFSGVIAAESASSITVEWAEGRKETLSKSDVNQVASTGVSLMPEGLEQGLSPQDIADLIRFLKDWRY